MEDAGISKVSENACINAKLYVKIHPPSLAPFNNDTFVNSHAPEYKDVHFAKGGGDGYGGDGYGGKGGGGRDSSFGGGGGGFMALGLGGLDGGGGGGPV